MIYIGNSPTLFTACEVRKKTVFESNLVEFMKFYFHSKYGEY